MGSLILSPNPLVERAVKAFAHRENLTVSDRRKLLIATGQISELKAWQVVKVYASGQMPEIGNAIIQLARAWLTLGQHKFEIAFRLFRLFIKAGQRFKNFKRQVAVLVEASEEELQRKLINAEAAFMVIQGY